MTKRKLATEFEQEESSPGLALWRATNSWQNAQRRALREFDLTHTQFVLLASLVWMDSKEPVTQRKLCAHAQLDEMMTSQVLRLLEKKGLIIRVAHPNDGRAMALSATAKGIKLANASVRVVEEVDRKYFSALADGGRRLTKELNILNKAAQ